MRGPCSDKDRTMLFDESLERRRRMSSDLFDVIVRAGADPVLVVDRDLLEVQEEEVIPDFLLGRPLGLCRQGSKGIVTPPDCCRHFYAGLPEPPYFKRLRSWCTHCDAFPLDGYLLGSYRIATAPEANSCRLRSFKSIRFDSPANNVGPWPASLGCTTNS
jgi:hypothetical protein